MPEPTPESPPTLPPKPQPPVGYDCCGGGCADCDLRRYLRELAHWKLLEKAYRERGIDPPADSASRERA